LHGVTRRKWTPRIGVLTYFVCLSPGNWVSVKVVVGLNEVVEVVCESKQVGALAMVVERCWCQWCSEPEFMTARVLGRS